MGFSADSKLIGKNYILFAETGVIGLSGVEVMFSRRSGIPPEAEIMKAIAARNVARKAKNFAESDRIRDELLAQGVVLKDGPTGTTWEVKR